MKAGGIWNDRVMRGKCGICGSTTREILQKKFSLKYHYCDMCGFISKDAENRISLEDELKIYKKHNNSIDDPRYVAYFKDFIDSAVIDFVSNGRRGLDFGSGPSPVLATILDRDYGFDMDIYDLFFAPNKVFSGKKYHLITSTEVFEHLGDPLEYFKLLAGCLEDDGLLSIMTLFHPLDDQEFLDWYYIRDMSHISFFTGDTMKVISGITGLDLVFTDNRRYTSFRLKG
jgi:hypothetical protein